MKSKPVSRGRRILLISLAGLFLMCIACVALSAASNRGLPQAASSDKLSELDKARLAEALHLKAQLGDGIWPGWGSAEIPVILWNKDHEFLIGYEGDQPPGWSPVPGHTFEGQTYLRRQGGEPQNFAEPVGDDWAASMAAKSSTDAFLIGQFQSMFPSPLKQIFPYRLIIQPSETQIGGVLHETFHVLQMRTAPDRMLAAEAAHRSTDEYSRVAADFSAEWKSEAELLAKALQAKTREDKLNLVHQFLAQRNGRRATFRLDPQLVDYERWLEWEEGVAKYIEVASLKAGFETAGYTPLPAVIADPDFKKYQRFNQRWFQEMIQLRYQTTAGEERLYASGMAQAFLLDELVPNWKEQYWGEGAFLEDLLKLATK